VIKCPFQGIRLGCSQSNLPSGFKIIKSQVSQFFQVAHFEQPIPGLFSELTFPAGTDSKFAEIRMPNREILAKISYTAADLTIRISGIGI
jgi:hypothetical protein